jgi:hypothetical protein
MKKKKVTTARKGLQSRAKERLNSLRTSHQPSVLLVLASPRDVWRLFKVERIEFISQLTTQGPRCSGGSRRKWYEEARQALEVMIQLREEEYGWGFKFIYLANA